MFNNPNDFIAEELDTIIMVDDEHDSTCAAIEVFLRIRPDKKSASSTPHHQQQHFFIDDIDETLITFKGRKSGASVGHDKIDDEVVNNSRTKHSFKFNGIMNAEAKQEEVFNCIGAPAVRNVLQGLNSTVFAYGQTGSGKVSSIFSC